MPGGSKGAPGLLSKEIAEILRAQKGRLRVTDQQIADAANMSRGQVQAVLNATKHVDVEQLDRICWALGLVFKNVLVEADKAASRRQSDDGWNTPRL